MRKTISVILKILPFAIIGVLIVAILASGKEMSVETVISYMPDNLALAGVLLLLMYAVKSLSVIFPLIVLQIAAGILLPVWPALFINIIGTAISYTLPYILGKISGQGTTEYIVTKYPKAREIIDMQRNSTWFPSFLLRAISILPGDIVSLCLGSIGVSYIPYVVASVIGTLPGLIPATIAGMSIMNPKSTVFILSVVATALSSVISVAVYWFIKKRR